MKEKLVGLLRGVDAVRCGTKSTAVNQEFAVQHSRARMLFEIMRNKQVHVQYIYVEGLSNEVSCMVNVPVDNDHYQEAQDVQLKFKLENSSSAAVKRLDNTLHAFQKRLKSAVKECRMNLKLLQSTLKESRMDLECLKSFRMECLPKLEDSMRALKECKMKLERLESSGMECLMKLEFLLFDSMRALKECKMELERWKSSQVQYGTKLEDWKSPRMEHSIKSKALCQIIFEDMIEINYSSITELLQKFVPRVEKIAKVSARRAIMRDFNKLMEQLIKEHGSDKDDDSIQVSDEQHELMKLSKKVALAEAALALEKKHRKDSREKERDGSEDKYRDGPEDKDGDDLKYLDSFHSESSPFYQSPEEETVFAFHGDTDDDSLTKQLVEFLEVLPNMNRESKPLLDEFDHLLKEIDALLEFEPSSSENSLCGEPCDLQVE